MLSKMGQSQRQLLKMLLEEKNGLTIDEMVRGLAISRTAVNQHIAALKNDGLVETHTRAKTGGRPCHVYVLSDRGAELFPRKYGWFAELLLRELQARLGSRELEGLLRGIGEALGHELRHRLHGKAPIQQLEEIVALMREFGYETSLAGDPAAEEPVVRALNCVYHHLAASHPQVCCLDLAFLSALSGRRVDHIECMVRGGKACQFRLREALEDSQKSDYQTLGEDR
ncbi:helix-turn-helix transcriptional regulator [Candidatus Methylocalor cossyra]|uniref:Iron-sulfur cluster regulator SufR n=1 Tax=Candidatus Methylocalor cossyra TaxID=3108543 RepID=A0ABM9NKN2_9GAMM